MTKVRIFVNQMHMSVVQMIRERARKESTRTESTSIDERNVVKVSECTHCLRREPWFYIFEA